MPNNENNEYLDQVQLDKIYDIHDARIKIGSLLPEEVERILNNMGMSRLEIGSELNNGDKVKVVDGPFKNMYGKIDNIDKDNNSLTVLIDLFGQETPVEVTISQVEKA